MLLEVEDETGESRQKTETNLENLFPRLVVFCLLLSSLSLLRLDLEFQKSIGWNSRDVKESGKGRDDRIWKEDNFPPIVSPFPSVSLVWYVHLSLALEIVSSLVRKSSPKN